MKIEWKASIGEIVNLIILVVGGIFGYFYVTEWEAKELEARVELTNIQSDIARIEKANMRIEKEVALSKARMETTVDLTELLSQIRPNIDIAKPLQTKLKNRVLTFTLPIENLGSHGVVIDRIHYSLYEKRGGDKLNEGTDYIVHDKPNKTTILKGQSGYLHWQIEFRNDKVPPHLFHNFGFTGKIEESIAIVAKSILKDYVDLKVLENITEQSYTRSGRLNFTGN